MLTAFQILTLLIVALMLVTTLSHALELPGKMRLSKENYLKVQPIYYPGFTFAGIAEPVGLLALLVLAVVFRGEGTAFWLTLTALLAIAAAHGLYWLVTHPVNNFWLKDTELAGAGKGFFGFGTRDLGTAPWTELRDRWEYSHLARSVLVLAAFLCLSTAIALD